MSEVDNPVPSEPRHFFLRLALGIEYDGSAYHGFQTQPSGICTVQKYLNDALSKIATHPVVTVCAGRTDAGVHASGQVVHFDTSVQRPETGWVLGTNSFLPPDISVRWAKVVSKNFHARFSARGRRYRYLIFNHPVRPAIASQSVTWQPKLLDTTLMQQAADYLLGEHDFTSFRSSECQAEQPVRIIRELSITRKNDWIVIEVEATAFLHNMVRNIVGTLYEVGMGKKSPLWVKEVLDARDRTCAGATAPPTGLYLVDVTYPTEFGLPLTELGPRFLTIS